MNATVKSLALSILDSYDTGMTFTTKEFTDAVYDAYQGSDKDALCNTVNQSKVRHIARWAQQTAKLAGSICRTENRGEWIAC